MDDQWLTVDDAAALLKVRTETIYRWVDRGLLPSTKIGRIIRINASELNRCLNGLPAPTAIDVTEKR